MTRSKKTDRQNRSQACCGAGTWGDQKTNPLVFMSTPVGGQHMLVNDPGTSFPKDLSRHLERLRPTPPGIFYFRTWYTPWASTELCHSSSKKSDTPPQWHGVEERCGSSGSQLPTPLTYTLNLPPNAFCDLPPPLSSGPTEAKPKNKKGSGVKMIGFNLQTLYIYIQIRNSPRRRSAS